jgi:uncharacterized protein YjbJ (UPF0337 family)
MGAEDKISNKAEDLGGKAKQSVGGLTGDRDMQDEGRMDQAKAAAKDAGEKLKDAGHKLKDAAGKLTDTVEHHGDRR